MNADMVRPVNHLSGAVEYLNGRSDLPIFKTDLDRIWNAGPADELDLEDVKGQEHAKRGLEVAAAGSHKVLTLYDILTRTMLKNGDEMTSKEQLRSFSLCRAGRVYKDLKKFSSLGVN